MISENNKIRLQLVVMTFLVPFIVALVQYFGGDGGEFTINDSDYPVYIGAFIAMYIFECVLLVTGFVCWVLLFPEMDGSGKR